MIKIIFLSMFFTYAAFAYDDMPRTDYETVAASQTLQVCGPNGKQGDILDKLIVVPTTTAAGTISVSDDAQFTVFNTGTLADLKPFEIPLGARAKSSTGWKVTTGANVSAICVGRFK